ncbi:hypothetical protein R7P80_01200 [Vibrio sp. 2092]|uniref:hypothetical protein n=1 Tax=Vibrio sp. 2092 TaxID=3074593 RepID=UPI002964BE7C|nr:hypothetical protein [Vibrio sp. 2092]MCA2471393.1 hypothetical protein [Vibrio alginolyticus]MDW2151413.1 hypothetical protein [Vibrio sp. 2092]
MELYIALNLIAKSSFLPRLCTFAQFNFLDTRLLHGKIKGKSYWHIVLPRLAVNMPRLAEEVPVLAVKVPVVAEEF